jgi:hypothetical protein
MVDTVIAPENSISPTPAGWRAAPWRSGLSWSAVIAGALTAIAVTIIVVSLGSGIGMSLASPYSYSPSTETLTIIGALWLVFAQAVGFATGGYVAGRLRRNPTPRHTSEVSFRDGANGLVAWAICVVVSTVLITAAAEKIGSAAAKTTTGAAAAGLSGGGGQTQPLDYYTDMLLRPNPQAQTSNNGAPAANGAPSSTNSDNAASRAPIGRIMATALEPNGLSGDDRTYLAQVISARTGISADDAQRRVDDVVKRAKESATKAADAARKAAAYLSFWTFMSLLFGAVCATLGAVLGGDLRDEFASRQAATVARR